MVSGVVGFGFGGSAGFAGGGHRVQGAHCVGFGFVGFGGSGGGVGGGSGVGLGGVGFGG
jgi:hypothetical protein